MDWLTGTVEMHRWVWLLQQIANVALVVVVIWQARRITRLVGR